MRISDIFNLNKSQYELDFVNIDVEHDLPLFLDPYFLSIRNDNWSLQASRTIQSFFSYFLALIQGGHNDLARDLFTHLHEPNETCLGMSKGRPSGRGIGPCQAEEIFSSIIQSRAVETGLLEHLEDCYLFVDGIGKDKVSDMTTNIIRGELLKYTQQQCKLWDIPLTPDVATGDIWDRVNRQWTNAYDAMLVIEGRKILLVPKNIVSYSVTYTPEKYTQHFVLNFLQQEHLRMRSALIERSVRKDGSVREFVTKKSIRAYTGIDKDFLTNFTLQHPEIFRDFQSQTKDSAREIPQHEYATSELNLVIDHLIGTLQAILPGRDTATLYHRTVTGILEILLYPHVVSPSVEQEVHDGRKRIDIVYDNAAEEGFFFRLGTIYQLSSQFIMVECKNYSRDVANPELDQIAGRFSPNRGKCGLILCRSIDNMDLFLERCSDTYREDRGLIIPIVDSDLYICLVNYETKMKMRLIISSWNVIDELHCDDSGISKHHEKKDCESKRRGFEGKGARLLFKYIRSHHIV